jgi:hypothetical protein
MEMAKNHGAKDQKRAAKQKAKRLAKRSVLLQRGSKDPTIRLQRAEKWSVVQALVGDKLWADGIGYTLIARRDTEGRLVVAVFLVDVYCLGVKDAFWRAGTTADVEELVRKMETTGTMSPIAPACLAKIVAGAVEYAQSFGFSPHPDFRHASKLLAGIDPSTCPSEFKFGRDGKPFYIQGPHETFAEAAAILQRVQDAGGHYIASLSGDDVDDSIKFGRELEHFEALEEDDSGDESL